MGEGERVLVLQGAKEQGKECEKGRNVFAFFYPDHQIMGTQRIDICFLIFRVMGPTCMWVRLVGPTDTLVFIYLFFPRFISDGR